jgi:hypothetical protein
MMPKPGFFVGARSGLLLILPFGGCGGLMLFCWCFWWEALFIVGANGHSPLLLPCEKPGFFRKPRRSEKSQTETRFLEAKRDRIAPGEKPGFFRKPRRFEKSQTETRFLEAKRDRIALHYLLSIQAFSTLQCRSED